jgi:hypothetical protein
MGVTEMSFKQVMFFSGCVVAWFVLLPLCIVGGGLALLSYAVFSEVGELVTKGRVDISTAREIARRVCLGY